MPLAPALTPDWLVHPGASIADALQEQRLSRGDAAARLGIGKKRLTDIIRGRAGIRENTALALSRVLGSTPAFWLRRQAHYDAERALSARRAGTDRAQE